MDLERVRGHTPSRITDEPRAAAVIVPVLERAGRPHLLLTKRAEHLGEHPGQMSLPGGGREAIDESLRATALREGHEEIGLREHEVTFVGRLDDIRTVTGYSVTPFVARIPDRTYVPSDAEVAEVVVLPLAGFTDRSNYESDRRDHPRYGEILIHFFHVDGYTVWGATGQIIAQFLTLATEWAPPEPADRSLDADPDPTD